MSKRPGVVVVNIACSLAIAVSAIVVALASGSAALISQGVQSLVSAGNTSLLLVGERGAKRPPDARHPFGHGKALFLWTLISVSLSLVLGGASAVYRGVVKVIEGGFPGDEAWPSLLVFGLAWLFHLIAWSVAWRALLEQRNGHGFLHALRTTRDSHNFAVFMGVGAAVVGVPVGVAGVLGSHALSDLRVDGVASITMGLLRIFAEVITIRRCAQLLVGEGASPELVAAIVDRAGADPAVAEVLAPRTMYCGAHDLVLELPLKFRPGLPVEEVAAATRRLTATLRACHGDLRHVAVLPA